MSSAEQTPHQQPVEGIAAAPYPHYPDLKGQSVFITGGGSGIGAYFVHAFAAQGAKVAFVSLSEAPAHTLCEAVAAATGLTPHFTACDIRDIAALQDAIAAAAAQNGPIGVLINNAARDTRHRIDELDVAGWDDSLDTNLRPHFFAAQAVAQAMRARGEGAIINVGSNSANLGLAGYPAYVTAKAAIVGLTRALARELGPEGVRVNALIPGWVMTARQKALWVTPDAIEECLAQQSLKRTIMGEDVAHAALFLASRAAAMITGQSLIVDGGRFMQ
ncbi:MAG: SDR family oxidoreductase [Alphaproteobacteria bacterium]|nr:MAG: SDR family oxidoreductase [Alphaproteobacteria bacterium]